MFSVFQLVFGHTRLSPAGLKSHRSEPLVHSSGRHCWSSAQKKFLYKHAETQTNIFVVHSFDLSVKARNNILHQAVSISTSSQAKLAEKTTRALLLSFPGITFFPFLIYQFQETMKETA